MADVFISYKREERAAVERLARGLRELGLSVWFDAALEGGSSFHDEIEREVRVAKAVVVCWTPSARGSRWVMGEAQIGLDRNVLAPIFLQPTELPPPFNTVHTLSLANWDGAHDDSDWLSFLDRLSTLLARRGLRHVAQALAAGEPIRVMGANEADETGDVPRYHHANNAKAGGRSGRGFFRDVGLYIVKVVLVLATGPVALAAMKRWALAALWIVAAVVGFGVLYATYPDMETSERIGISSQGLAVAPIGVTLIFALVELGALMRGFARLDTSAP